MVRGAFGGDTPAASQGEATAGDVKILVGGDLNLLGPSLKLALDVDPNYLGQLSFVGHSEASSGSGYDDRDWIGAYGHSQISPCTDEPPRVAGARDHACVIALVCSSQVRTSSLHVKFRSVSETLQGIKRKMRERAEATYKSVQEIGRIAEEGFDDMAEQDDANASRVPTQVVCVC